MQKGTKAQGAQLLQRLLDKYNGNLPSEINAFALLRYDLVNHSTQLLTGVDVLLDYSSQLLTNPGQILTSCARGCVRSSRYVCTVTPCMPSTVLTSVAVQVTQTQATTPSLTPEVLLRECQWFEKNAYNAAITHLHVWCSRTVIDLLQYSCQVSFSP
jgi:hypothetical protein